jgi:phosphate transport system substrate-binding protein
MKNIKKIIVIALSLMLIVSMVACTNGTNNTGDKNTDNTGNLNNNDNNKGNENDKPVVVKGSINAGGSTSVEKAAKAAMEEFVALNPEVTFEYDSTGSSAGIKNAKDGTYKLGFSSRELKQEETQGIEYKTIALDGIALVIHPSNKIENITLEQIKGIFTGEIKNWSELGGVDAEIVVVSRENGSGTRSAFEEIAKIGDLLTEKAIIKSGNGEVASYVAGEPNAIGYTSFVTLEANSDKIKGLQVESVKPEIANVQNQTYKLSRPFIMIYDLSKLNEAEKAFINFLFTEEGQDVLEEAGAIRIK